VAVNVKVQGSSATVTVDIDGKEKFRGTMLPGTTQVFRGTKTVTVSTTNASATSLTVTNTTVAAKDLGALGNINQPRDGFQFDKDTQFQ
jgi:hypothetical protein